MAKFMVRVELHSATGKDYDKLHEAMDKAGFSRLIEGSDEKRYHLPTAEYRIESSRTLENVQNAAQSAANSTGKANAVVCCQYISARWSGLTQVPAKRQA